MGLSGTIARGGADDERAWKMVRSAALFVVCSAFATALLLAACSAGRALPVEIRDFDTARFTLEHKVTAGGQEFTIHGEGTIDQRNGAIDITLSNGPPARIVAIGDEVYTYDALQGQWYSSPSATYREQEPLISSGALEELLPGVTEVQELGEETIGGRETTHYLLRLDPQRVREWFEKGPGATFIGEEVQEELWGTLRMEAELWIDNRTRYTVQETFTTELLPKAPAPLRGHMEMTWTFFDFDREVEIEPPEGAIPNEQSFPLAPPGGAGAF